MYHPAIYYLFRLKKNFEKCGNYRESPLLPIIPNFDDLVLLPCISFLNNYCNVAWSSTSNLNCIYLLQKRLVRLIIKAHYLANTAPLFSQLKVLDIFSINSFSVANIMYSYHHNLLPNSFHDLFLSSNQVHQYETRLASQYRPHFCRTNIKQFSNEYPLPRT